MKCPSTMECILLSIALFCTILNTDLQSFSNKRALGEMQAYKLLKAQDVTDGI